MEHRLSDHKLVRRLTIDQAVQENTYDGIPFGHARDDWARLLAKMLPGDELWEFEPPSPRTFQNWGIVLMRDGKIVSRVVLAVD